MTLLPNQGAPALTVVEPQGNGPPTVKLNPAILAPAGGTSYAGSGYYNSGFLLPLMDPTPAPRDYALTFTAPGTYTYGLHVARGHGHGRHDHRAGHRPRNAHHRPRRRDGLLLALAGLALLLGGVTLRRRLALR